MYQIILILILLITIKSSNCQIDKNWYFTEKAGIRFNDLGEADFLLNGRLVPYTSNGCGTISDFNGNLLFYTDGDTAYNRNHQVMQNGFPNYSLNGAGGQACFIAKSPATDNKYFIFKSSGPNNVDSGYLYSIVDMDLDNGLGAVILKNKRLTLGGCERFTALPHANGLDFWLVTRLSIGNTFKTYKVTCQGVQENNPITQNIGTIFTTIDFGIGIGNMKSSPQGNKIAFNFGIENRFFEVLNFDNATGLLSNPIKVIPPGGKPYGVGFSPNGNLLYVNIDSIGAYPFARRLLQYKIDIMDSVAINSSRILLDSTNAAFGQFQIGPNGKLYVCSNNVSTNYLSEVSNPNVYGTGCNFIANSVWLGGRNHVLNLPYFLPSQTAAANTQFTYTVNPDCRTVNFIGKTYIRGNNLSFKWKFTATDSITQIIPSMGDTSFATTTFTFPPGIDSFNVQLFVTSDTVCGLGRAGKLVVVKPPPPKAKFGFSSTCNNLTVNFSDSSLLNFNPSISYQYQYKLATAPNSSYVNFSVQPSPVFTFAALDSFDVRLIVTSFLSCVPQDSFVRRIVLKAKPLANASYVNNCGSLQVSFTNTSTIAAGNIATTKYYLGNTQIGTNNFNYSFTNYGSYIVKQIAESNFNCVSDTNFITVVVKAKPILQLNTLRDSICNNTSITINANATVQAAAVNNYVWLKNNLVFANNANSFSENLTTGTYAYKVVAQSNQNCNSDTVTKTITVVSKPILNFNAINNCGSLQINNTSSSNVINDVISNYYINWGNGVLQNISSIPSSYSYTNYDNYTIKIVAQSSIGCNSDTVFQNINIKAKPQAIFTINNTNLCENNTASFTANSTVLGSTITNHSWQLNNNAWVNTTVNNFTTNNLPAGNYVIKYAAQSNVNCSSDTIEKTFVVENNSFANFSISGKACENETLNFTANNILQFGSIINHEYKILQGATIVQTLNTANSNYNFTKAGNYVINYQSKTANSCVSNVVTKNIIIESKPTTNFNNTAACLGNAILFTNTSTNNVGNINNFIWKVDNVQEASTTNFTTSFTQTKNYTVQLIATTDSGCSNIAQKTFDIKPITVFAGNDTTVVANTNFILNPQGAINFAWQPINLLDDANIKNPIFNAPVGTYNYTLISTDAQGCQGSDDIKIIVRNSGIYLPNAFTPNGDGLNDFLRGQIAGYTLKRFSVYNRFSQLVYTTTNTINWDGRYKNNLVDKGNYVWVAECVGGKVFKGNVLVL